MERPLDNAGITPDNSSELLNRLREWYWTNGIKRGKALCPQCGSILEQNNICPKCKKQMNPVFDIDREKRKMTIGDWLDPVERIIARINAIHANSHSKSCLAVWGPSQSGKSTILSRYVDGKFDPNAEGDSALTWDEISHKARFSAPGAEFGGTHAVSEDTVIFNPYHDNSDASGIATRYTLKSLESDEKARAIPLRDEDKVDCDVNVDFPVEVKFSTRAQIIHSLCLGYLSECKPKSVYLTSAELLKKASYEQRDVPAQRDAYELVEDIANVLEFMDGHVRFLNLFSQGDWAATRKNLVSSTGILKDIEKVERFLADIFWDSEKHLTDFYKKAQELLADLKKKWGNRKILASIEAGALLLDIDSFTYITDSQRVSEADRKMRKKICSLAYEIIGDEVHIFVAPDEADNSPEISGKKFGIFQAICAEMVVPLRKKKLEESGKEDFLKLMKMCDLLDIPGVNTRNRGNNQKTAKTKDLTNADEGTICTEVFKQGKTQCFVYNYVKSYGIDAFAILCRAKESPDQSSLLNAGIQDWIYSFDPDWEYNQKPKGLSIFVNLTFCATLINSLSQNRDNSLRPYRDRIEELTFARPSIAKFFFTTYPQHVPDGKIITTDEPIKAEVIQHILSDPDFKQATGLKEENRADIECLYEDDGGQDHMLKGIVAALTAEKEKSQNEVSSRTDLCNKVLKKDRAALIDLICENEHLPSDDDSIQNDRKEKLQECIRAIDDVMAGQLPDEGLTGANQLTADEVAVAEQQLVEVLENFFSVDKSVFERLPTNAANKADSELTHYVKDQITKWYNDRNANAAKPESGVVKILAPYRSVILTSLRDSIGAAEIDKLVQLLRKQLGGISDWETASAATRLFSFAFSNLLRYGDVTVTSDFHVDDRNPGNLNAFISRATTPYRFILTEQVKKWLENLAEKEYNCNGRPRQPGDAELQELFNAINESTTMFSI